MRRPRPSASALCVALRVASCLALCAGAASAEDAPLPLAVARASAANRARFAAGDDPIAARATWPTSPPADDLASVALGAEAFALFPVGVDATWELRIGDDHALRAAGVTLEPNGDAAGLLFVEEDGRWQTAYSCMLCHARADADGRSQAGPANAALRYGDLLADAYPDHPRAAEWRAWGAGRLDVTDDGSDDPLRIPDLVALRSVTYLQASGAVAARSPASLPARIEAVLARSPVPRGASRALSIAIASWLRTQPEPSPPDATMTEGARLFRASCARCHEGPALGGRALIDAPIVGTDARAANDALRGTGAYRVPPLLGAGSRARFFHDGALAQLADVIDPRRLQRGFRGGALAPGPIGGHRWGTDLDAKARAAIVDYLSSSRW